MTHRNLRQMPTNTGATQRQDRQKAAASALPVRKCNGYLLVSVYKADPDGRPVIHHRVVDTIGRMLRNVSISRELTTRGGTSPRRSPSRSSIRSPVCRSIAYPDRATPPIQPMLSLTPDGVSPARSTCSAGGCTGTSSVCNARSASGQCARVWGGRPIGEKQAHSIQSRRWGCW